MNLFVFFLGGFVFFVALFKRELLAEDESFKVIRGITVILFLGGIVLYVLAIGRETPLSALLSPLISLYLYRFGRSLFLKKIGREPKDTFLDWTKGLAPDRLFNVVYFILAEFVWIASAIVSHELAKAGW